MSSGTTILIPPIFSRHIRHPPGGPFFTCIILINRRVPQDVIGDYRRRYSAGGSRIR